MSDLELYQEEKQAFTSQRALDNEVNRKNYLQNIDKELVYEMKIGKLETENKERDEKMREIEEQNKIREQVMREMEEQNRVRDEQSKAREQKVREMEEETKLVKI